MEKKRGIDSFTLHILAMLFMLCDHLWATLFPAQEWMTCVGRLAFPIFAFMIAEGCYYTSNVKKYMLRLFLFAIIFLLIFLLASYYEKSSFISKCKHSTDALYTGCRKFCKQSKKDSLYSSGCVLRFRLSYVKQKNNCCKKYK